MIAAMMSSTQIAAMMSALTSSGFGLALDIDQSSIIGWAVLGHA
mgnify:CR=1 FL=1